MFVVWLGVLYIEIISRRPYIITAARESGNQKYSIKENNFFLVEGERKKNFVSTIKINLKK